MEPLITEQNGAWVITVSDIHGTHRVVLTERPKLTGRETETDDRDYPEAWGSTETFTFQAGPVCVEIVLSDGSHTAGVEARITVDACYDTEDEIARAALCRGRP